MVKKPILTICILFIIFCLIVFNIVKRNTFSLKSFVDKAKIEVPMDSKIVSFKKYYSFFSLSEIFLHIKIPEIEIGNFTSPYITNDNIIKANGLKDSLDFFLRAFKLDAKEINYKYIFVSIYVSPKSTYSGFDEVIMILKPINGYCDVYICKTFY
jgi:hypothetical protein